jgi:hypothetical protein
MGFASLKRENATLAVNVPKRRKPDGGESP